MTLKKIERQVLDLASTGASGQAVNQTDAAHVATSGTPAAVASSGSMGSGVNAAPSDHAHEGVHSLAKNGDTALKGDITLSEGSGVTLTRVGQDIAIAATAAPSSVGIFFFGSGYDGAVTVTVNTTLTRDIHATTYTVNNGAVVTAAGFRIYATTSITLGGASAGTIRNLGTVGGSGAGGGAAGTGAPGITVGRAPGGGVGGTGVGAAPTAPTYPFVDASAGAGGAGGAGDTGAGGAAGTRTYIQFAKQWQNIVAAGVIPPYTTTTPQTYSCIVGGAGGGGGGGDGAGRGGGGGGGGGLVYLAAPTITINANGTISTQGGGGGDGQPGTTGTGGGGGGGGGTIEYVYSTAITRSGTETVSGGAGGAKQGTGVAGSAGGSGAVIAIQVSNVT